MKKPVIEYRTLPDVPDPSVNTVFSIHPSQWHRTEWFLRGGNLAQSAAIFIPGSNPGDWPPNPQVLTRACDERIVVWLEPEDQSGLSALAAPLIVRDEVAAVVYLESSGPEHRFDEGHMQVLTAVAGMAAVAWENATILGWLQEENERLQTQLKIEHGMVGPSEKLRRSRV